MDLATKILAISTDLTAKTTTSRLKQDLEDKVDRLGKTTRQELV